jgi:hypothetical protein
MIILIVILLIYVNADGEGRGNKAAVQTGFECVPFFAEGSVLSFFQRAPHYISLPPLHRNKLSNSMEQNSYCEAESRSENQEIFRLIQNPEVPLRIYKHPPGAHLAVTLTLFNFHFSIVTSMSRSFKWTPLLVYRQKFCTYFSFPPYVVTVLPIFCQV